MTKELEQIRRATKLASFMREVRAERERQYTKWGEQKHAFEPSPALRRLLSVVESHARHEADTHPTWAAIFAEEACEFALAPDADNRKEELIQVAALCLQMWEKL